jgi:hypothetical protein
VELQRLILAAKTLSPSIFIFALVLGLKSGIGLYQLTRIPLTFSLSTISAARPRVLLQNLAAFMGGMMTAFVALGFLFATQPLFGLWFALQTKVIYLVLGGLCLILGLLVSGLLGPRDAVMMSLLEHHRGATMVITFMTGALFSLVETPICPSCGSILSQMAALGPLLGSLRLAALFMLYSMGESMILILAGLPVLIFYYRILSKNSAAREYFGLTSGFLLIFAALFYFWTS